MSTQDPKSFNDFTLSFISYLALITFQNNSWHSYSFFQMKCLSYAIEDKISRIAILQHWMVFEVVCGWTMLLSAAQSIYLVRSCI